MYTNTGYEYWGRAASLIHTSLDGQGDVAPLPNERLYLLASGQHFVGGFSLPARERRAGTVLYRGNPLNFLFNLRALLVRLVGWVRDGAEPPPSAYPRLADGTLVPMTRVRFPQLPGVPLPQAIHEAYRVDYGPQWSRGIITTEPPRLGAPFPTLVAQVDSLGNELGGIRNVEIQVPLATYTPWLVRHGYAGGAQELVDFLGSVIPLPRTEAERLQRRESRPSIAALYADRAVYLTQAQAAVAQLVRQGYLLEEDVARVLTHAESLWEWSRR